MQEAVHWPRNSALPRAESKFASSLVISFRFFLRWTSKFLRTFNKVLIYGLLKIYLNRDIPIKQRIDKKKEISIVASMILLFDPDPNYEISKRNRVTKEILLGAET